MLLWLVFAVLSAAVLAALLRPLLGRSDMPQPSEPGDAAVYRDQLAEIDAEAGRGLIGPEEAEAARREIARRLLASMPPEPRAEPAAASPAACHPTAAASDTAPPAAEAMAALRPSMPSGPALRSAPSISRRARLAAAVLGVLIPVAATAIYLRSGDPHLPAQPFAQRRPPTPVANLELTKLITAVEARLAQNPHDGRGWDVIAPVYLRLGRYGDAAEAYENALRILGDSPQRLAALAEASMLANEGRVLPVARAALEKLLALDRDNVRARFWLAHAKEQDGDLAAAAADYEALLAKAPPGADWRKPVEERLAEVRAARAGKPPASPATPAAAGPAAAAGTPATPGPTATDIAAAERLTPAERQAMIEGMVSGLAARLEKDGRDLAGWQRLIRALTVMGRKDEAIAALGKARKSFAGEPQALSALADLARALGLGS
jgi:cytochrome c-type biogenesis protein CcmH